MLKIKYIFLFLLISITLKAEEVFTDSLSLSDETWIQIDSIEIRGNKITEEFVILRELTFGVGDEINKSIIDFNRERIYSLGIFNFVHIFAEKRNELVKTVIEVKESWNIYPIPFLHIRDKEFKQTSYGMYLLYKNFRGRNETIQGVISFGYDKFFQLSYINPLLIESEDINMTTTLMYQTPVNKSEKAEIIHGAEFDYTKALGQVSLGKRINKFSNLFATLAFGYVEAPDSNYQGIMASHGNIDRSLVFGGSYIYDSRDLKQFAQKGVYGKTEFLHYGLFNSEINYNIVKTEYRQYQKVFEWLVTKWRTDFRHTFGRLVPLYDYSTFGYSEYVRGHRNEVREGNNFLLSSFEITLPIIREWDIKMDLPLLPTNLTSARIGIHLTGFADAGATFNNNEKLAFDDFYSGYGFGVTVLVLPFNAIRFEYAFDEYKQGEFLIGTGFSF